MDKRGWIRGRMLLGGWRGEVVSVQGSSSPKAPNPWITEGITKVIFLK